MDLMVNPTITGFRQDVDGTIKELKIGQAKEDAFENIIAQGGAVLEDNKEVTIDVSTYTQPVVVNPTSGKDGMKKATITLSNIPSGAAFQSCAVFDDRNTSPKKPDTYLVFFETDDYPEVNTTIRCLILNNSSSSLSEDTYITNEDLYEGEATFTEGEAGSGETCYYLTYGTGTTKTIVSKYTWTDEQNP